jgi:hypothetical protein
MVRRPKELQSYYYACRASILLLRSTLPPRPQNHDSSTIIDSLTTPTEPRLSTSLYLSLHPFAGTNSGRKRKSDVNIKLVVGLSQISLGLLLYYMWQGAATSKSCCRLLVLTTQTRLFSSEHSVRSTLLRNPLQTPRMIFIFRPITIL